MVPFPVCVQQEFAPHTPTHNIVSFAVELFFKFSNKIRFYMNGTEIFFFFPMFTVQRMEAHRFLLGGGVTWLYEQG